jgi:uncharacterized membrane protein
MASSFNARPSTVGMAHGEWLMVHGRIRSNPRQWISVISHEPSAIRHSRMRMRRAVVTCYSLELVSLAIWVGGLIVIIAAVIPAVFNSLSMEMGGRFLTRVFEGYNRLVLVAAIGLVALGIVRWTLQDRPLGPVLGLSTSELIILAAMVVIAGLIIFVLQPASVSLQEQAFAAKAEGERKAAYDAFFRSHTVVRALYVVNLGLGMAMIPIKVRRMFATGGAG